jgi:hemolysin activation/secretion protein
MLSGEVDRVSKSFRSIFSRLGGVFALAALAFFAFSFAALAQRPPGVPDIGSATRDALKARPNPPPTREDPGLNLDPVDRPKIPGLAEGATIFVKDLKLEGALYLKEADVNKVLEPFKGRDLTLSQIERIADQVTALYREKGYPNVQVALSPETSTDGTIIFRATVPVLK